MNNPLLEIRLSVAGNSMGRFALREDAIKQYAYAIPNTEAIKVIIKCGPIVEIGAGLGYWASLISVFGGDIVATDKHYPKYNSYFGKTTKAHFPIEHISAIKAAEKYHTRSLLTIWPSYNEPWAYKASKEYLKLGGKTIIYVGESMGGCTGDDDFHELLGTLKLQRTVYIPQWPYIHDALEIYGA